MTDIITPIPFFHKLKALCLRFNANPISQSMFILIGFGLLATSINGQSISVTGVSPNPVCAGSTMTVTFSTTNGSGGPGQYSNSTIYTIYLSNSAGTSFAAIGSTFNTTAVSYSPANGGATNGITTTVTIPAVTVGGSGYRISIGSSSPGFDASSGLGQSPVFTINPLPQGSLTSNGPFCVSGAGTLTWTATTGTGPYTVVYNDGVSNRTASGVVSGTPFAVFTTPVTTNTSYTLVSVTDVNCTRTSGFTTGSASIVVNPLPQGSLTANGPFCTSGAGTLTWTATAGTGLFTVVYNDGVADRTVNNVTSGTPFPVFTTPVTNSTTYTLVSVANATCQRTSGFTAGSASIVVNTLPANPGNPTSNSPQCADVGVTLTSNGTPPVGETWYWQNSSGGTSIANSGSTYNVTSSGIYYIRARNNTSLCWSSGEGSLAVVVNPLPTSPGNPSSNTPQCVNLGVTLTQVGSAPVGETWYWQTAASGTSIANSSNTYNVSSSGTYYLRSRNNSTLCWSSGAGNVAVVVNALPANPGNPTSNSPQCADVGVTLTSNGTPPVGETWYWQTSSGGTSMANSGSTYNVTSLGTYYIRARNNTTSCWSTGEGSLAVTVNPLPATPGNPISNSPQCVNVGVTLTQPGSVPGGETWFWQATSNGTNTANSVNAYTVYSSGTYYLRSRNNSTLCWSSGAGNVAVVVNALPVATLVVTETSGVSSIDNIICAGANVTFTATAGFSNYNFGVNGSSVQNGASNSFSSTTLTNGALVTVDVTNSNNCQASFGPVNISVNPIPDVSASPSTQNICSGGSANISFSSSVPGATFAWDRDVPGGISGALNGSGNISSVVYNNSTSGPVNINFHAQPSANGCTGSKIFNIASVSVLPVPTVNAVSSQTVCHGSSTAAVNFAGTATSFNWTNSNTAIGLASPGTGNIASFAGTNSGTAPISGTINVIPHYVVDGTDCSGTGTSFSITVNPLPALTSTLNPPATCSNSVFNYNPATSTTGVTSTTFYWSRAAVTGISNVAATGTGNPAETLVNTTSSAIDVTYVYTVSITNNSVTCSTATSNNVVVSVKPTPTVAMSANGALSVCQGVSNNFAGVTLSNPNNLPGTSFSWTSSNTTQISGLAGSGTDNIPSATVTNTSGIIQYSTLTATATLNGCSSSTTVTLQVNPPISVNTISNLPPETVEQGICSISKQVTFTSPTAQGGAGNGTYTYQWQVNFTGNSADYTDIPGATSQTMTHNYPITNAFFRRIAYSDGCAALISNEAHLNPGSAGITQTISASNYCAGGTGVTVTLSGSVVGATYTLQYEPTNNNWVTVPGYPQITGTGGSISFTDVKNPGAQTSVNFRIYGSTGSCNQDFPEVTVTINPLPLAPTVNAPAAICAGTNTNIVGTRNAADGNSVLVNWYTTSTTGIALNAAANPNTYNVSPASTATYYAEAYNTTTGCVNNTRTPVTVTVNQKPNITNTNPAAICSPNTTNIVLANDIVANGTPGLSYSWYASDNPNTTGETFSPTQNTSTISNTITNNTNSQQIVNYNVTATYPVGCVGNSKVIAVTVDPKPVIASFTNAGICSNNLFNITPTASGNTIPTSPVTQYTWTDPTVPGLSGGSAQNIPQTSISQTLVNGTAAIINAVYTVTPTAGSCTGNPFNLTVPINPKPFVADQAVAVCSGFPFTLPPFSGGSNIVPAGTTYGWSVPTGSNISGYNGTAVSGQSSILGTVTNTSSPASPATATYAVTATAGTCSGSFQMVVTINPLPTLSGPTTVCAGATIQLTGATPPDPSTPWTSATTSVATVNATGLVTGVSSGTSVITYKNSYGCTVTTTVTVNAAPTANISGDATICPSGSSTLTITIPGTGVYSGTLTGGIAFSGNAPTISVVVSPVGTTTYSIASLTNGTCLALAAGLTGTATVTIPSGTPGVWTCAAGNSDWFDCRNWADGVVPTNSTNVNISIPGAGCSPIINPASPNASSFGGIARAANILISGSANLSFAGAGNLYVAGNWTNNAGPAGFTAGTSTVTFMGGTGAGCSQTIATTGTNAETFNNLVINNSCASSDATGNHVALNSPVNVSGTFTLTDGIVKTTSTNILTITNPAVGAVVGGSTGSYINGPITRYTNSTASYIYPIGNPAGAVLYGVYRPATVTPGSSAANSYTGQYFPTAAPEIGNMQLGTQGLIKTEYWDIRPAGVCSGNAVIGLPYVNPGNTSDWTAVPCSSCNVAVAKPAQPSNAWYFTDYPNYVGSGFNGSTPEDRFYTNSGVIYTKPIDCTGFQSPHFTFGFNYSVILPVKLTSFEGKLQARDALLNWEVADAKDLAGFELQHSDNGNSFKKLTYINGNNNNHYQYTDPDIQTGAHFYRLMLVDKNGHSSYSKTVLLVVGKNVTLINGIRPNPVNNNGYINIWSASPQKVRIEIYDMTGRLISQQVGNVAEGSNELPVKTQMLAQGVYNMVVRTEDHVQKNLRIVKE